jgi:hypothetical protein
MISSRRSRKASAGPSKPKQRGYVTIPETVDEEGSGITVHSVFENRIGKTEYLEHDYKGKAGVRIPRIRDYALSHWATSGQHQAMLLKAEVKVRELENEVRLQQLENDRFAMRVEFVKGLIEKGMGKVEVGELLSLLK